MKTSRVVPVVLQLSALFVALGTGRLAAAPNEAFLGRWALTLPNGAAGWLEITKEKGYYDGSILWGGGSVLPVSSVVITEDTVTRGTSALDAALAVRALGAEPVLVLVVVDRGGTCAAMAAAEGIAFHALITAPDLGFPYEGA